MTTSPPAGWPPLPKEGMIEEILDIIAHETKVDRAALTPDATLASLNIASIDMVSILFEIEDRFGVYIPMGDELAGTVYLADLVKVMAEQMQPDTLKDLKAG